MKVARRVARRPSRLAVAATLVSVALTAHRMAPAGADHGVARDVEGACVYAGTAAFSDRPEAGAGDAVDCVAFYGITTGATTTTFAPGAAVSRGQMASFIVRAGDVAGSRVASPEGDPFDDDDGDVHEVAIGRLAASGVASGFADGTFRPRQDVTRGQMASFIARELRLVTGSGLPAAKDDHFADDDGTTHEAAIDQLAGIGVVAGTDEDTFEPEAPVTRGQMALLLARSLDWLTEVDGAALARIGVADPTGSPELRGATSSTSGTTATVAFRFDEPVATSTILVTGFAVIGYDGRATTATSATRDAIDQSVVRATFPSADERLATTATVARNAVQDPAGNLAPEGAAPLHRVSLLPGTTSAPDLFSVSRFGAGTVDFNFDEAAHVLDPTGYHLVLADGTALDSSAAVGDGTTSHNVRFPGLTAEQATRVVRGYVDAATVSDAAQAPPTGPGPDGVEGDVNPQQAVPVTAGGALAGVPDLLQVAVDADADAVRFTFDEAVTLVPHGTPILRPTPFRLYDLDGGEVTSGDAVAVEGDNRTVAVTFAAGSVSLLAAGASVDAGAVTSTASLATNRVDEEGLARTFGAGETAAPDLLRAGRVQQPGRNPLVPSTVRRVVFELDQRTVLRSATAFAVLAADGSRTALTGCAASGERFVACSADSTDDPDGFAAIGAAAFATVEGGALVDSSGSFPSHAGAAVL